MKQWLKEVFCSHSVTKNKQQVNIREEPYTEYIYGSCEKLSAILHFTSSITTSKSNCLNCDMDIYETNESLTPLWSWSQDRGYEFVGKTSIADDHPEDYLSILGETTEKGENQ